MMTWTCWRRFGSRETICFRSRRNCRKIDTSEVFRGIVRRTRRICNRKKVWIGDRVLGERIRSWCPDRAPIKRYCHRSREINLRASPTRARKVWPHYPQWARSKQLRAMQNKKTTRRKIVNVILVVKQRTKHSLYPHQMMMTFQRLWVQSRINAFRLNTSSNRMLKLSVC